MYSNCQDLGLPSYKLKLLLVRYSNACLRLFVVILQDLYYLHISYHNINHWCNTLYQHTNLVELLLVRYNNACLRLFVLIIGVLSFTITPISTFIRAFQGSKLWGMVGSDEPHARRQGPLVRVVSGRPIAYEHI